MENNILKEPERGLNLTFDNFRTRLQVFLSESELPISVVYYIMKDITRELENLYNETVNKEYEQFKQESQEFFQKKEELEGDMKEER